MPRLNDEQKQKLAWAKEQFGAGELDGRSTAEIGQQLRKAGLDKYTRQAFAKWFIEKGLLEGWLYDELGLG